MHGIVSERGSVVVAGLLAVGSVGVGVVHLWFHQAPLVPTVLGQWLLLGVGLGLVVAVGYRLRAAKDSSERATVARWTTGAYLLGGAISLPYSLHKYVTPLADVGLGAVVFETVFSASCVGIAGVVVGHKSIRQRQALAAAERRREQLAHRRELTDNYLDALPGVFYAFDTDGEFLEWNQRLAEVTGYEAEAIQSMHPVEFIAEPDQQAVLDAMTRVFDDEEWITVDARFETKDGELIPYEFTGSPIPGPDGETQGLAGVGRDLSRIKKQQRRFRAIFDNMYQFIGLMEPDGRVIEANETALEFGGLDRDEVVGEKLWETAWFQQSEDTRQQARDAVEVAAEGSLYREEVTIQGATGTEIIDFSVRPITDDTGEVTLLIPEGRLITALKDRERHLQVLHRFLRHNLRNQMTVIQAHAEALSERLSQPEHVESVSQIEDAAVELSELSDKAHELSKIAFESDPQRRPVDLQATLAFVERAVEEDYPPADVEVQSNVDLFVKADWRLRRVLIELVENGIEHVESTSPTVEIGAESEDGAVQIHILDEGPGIPEDELAGIVTEDEPTQLTHGTGFGLWLARLVVDDYGGQISYVPRSEGGSALLIELERTEPTETATAASPTT